MHAETVAQKWRFYAETVAGFTLKRSRTFPANPRLPWSTAILLYYVPV